MDNEKRRDLVKGAELAAVAWLGFAWLYIQANETRDRRDLVEQEVLGNLEDLLSRDVDDLEADGWSPEVILAARKQIREVFEEAVAKDLEIAGIPRWVTKSLGWALRKERPWC